MTEVNKVLAEAVWKASEETNSIKLIAAQAPSSPSERMVSRLRTARAGFKEGQPDGTIATKIGWSSRRVAQLRLWWIAYDASRSPASTPVALQTDAQIVLNAKGLHLDEVRRLIGDWKGCFEVRSPWDIWWAGPDPFSAYDDHPLFEQLGPHVGSKLWDDYLRYRHENNVYLGQCAQLRTETMDKAPWGTNMPMASATNDMGPNDTYGWAIFKMALAVAEGTLPSKKLNASYNYQPPDFLVTDLVALEAAGYRILVVHGSDVERHRDHHIALVLELAASAEAQELVHLQSNLAKSVAAILKDIDQLLTSRNYVQRSCGFPICAGVQA